MQVIWFKSHCMKKELYIQIPEPCHEDWSKMTPVDQGRYCQSCCKEVVDFSAMTDQEIISFLSKPRGKTCGNFSSDQLNRIITEPATPAKKKFWAMMLSFLVPLFVFNKAKSQFRAKKAVDTVQTSTSTLKRAMLGKVAVSNCKIETEFRGDTIINETQPGILIHGKISDTAGNPITFASIEIIGKNKGTAADANGEFNIQINEAKTVQVRISAIGYLTKELSVPLSGIRITQNIVLTPYQHQLDDIIITAVARTKRGGYYAGGISIIREQDIVTKVIDTVSNLINPSVIKIYPNPASKNSFVNVKLSQKGEYQLNLVDNNGKTIQENKFSFSNKHMIYQLELPQSIAAGMYYITVIDEKTHKQYTQKLIVQ